VLSAPAGYQDVRGRRRAAGIDATNRELACGRVRGGYGTCVTVTVRVTVCAERCLPFTVRASPAWLCARPLHGCALATSEFTSESAGRSDDSWAPGAFAALVTESHRRIERTEDDGELKRRQKVPRWRTEDLACRESRGGGARGKNKEETQRLDIIASTDRARTVRVAGSYAINHPLQLRQAHPG
jgi:hypothetical protein